MDYLDYTYLAHHGIKGQKWGVRRYQNPDGSLTEAGKSRRSKLESKIATENRKISSTYNRMPSHYVTDIGKARQEKAVRKIAVSNKKIQKYQRTIQDLEDTAAAEDRKVLFSMAEGAARSANKQPDSWSAVYNKRTVDVYNKWYDKRSADSKKLETDYQNAVRERYKRERDAEKVISEEPDRFTDSDRERAVTFLKSAQLAEQKVENIRINSESQKYIDEIVKTYDAELRYAFKHHKAKYK